jgi:hypothetical protein
MAPIPVANAWGKGPSRHYDRRVLAFTVEDLARAALVRILPRSRYRLAAQNDARFQAFASNTTRIAYRQLGATPAFLLFSGPGQDARAAATAAAAWAEANWRPNAVQRTVLPGVVVVQVAPRSELTVAGPVAGAAVPAAVWTVDSETGRVEIAGNPPGSPSSSELRRAAVALMQAVPPPSLGELDLAERAVMQVRTVAMPRMLTGVVGVVLFILALRYGLGGLLSLAILPGLLTGSLAGMRGGAWLAIAGVVVNVMMLAGILVGAALYFNFRNLAFRLPGFSSPVTRTRNLAWGGYVAVMIALAIGISGVLPLAERGTVASNGPAAHVTATVDDDGGDITLAAGGDLTVDLTGWPSSEWKGVQFKTSNPSILSLDTAPPASGPPIARFTAHQAGVSRVDATSADGRYTFQARVGVVAT